MQSIARVCAGFVTTSLADFCQIHLPRILTSSFGMLSNLASLIFFVFVRPTATTIPTMTSIDWHKLALNAGVLLEAVPESNRLVLWLPAGREHGCQFWQRIGSVPNADIRVKQGLCSVPATAIRARQRVGGLLRGLLRGFHRASDEQTWMLPNGGAAEQSSERQTDLILVWPLEEMDALDEARLRSIWPEGKPAPKFRPTWR